MHQDDFTSLCVRLGSLFSVPKLRYLLALLIETGQIHLYSEKKARIPNQAVPFSGCAYEHMLSAHTVV